MASRARQLAKQRLMLVHSAEETEGARGRRFHGPLAHYEPSEVDAVDVVDFDELGLSDEQSGIRRKPTARARSTPPPIPPEARRKRLRAPARDARVVDFEDVLRWYPPIFTAGDDVVPPAPGIPIFRVLLPSPSAPLAQNLFAHVAAMAADVFGEGGLDLVRRTRRSAADAARERPDDPAPPARTSEPPPIETPSPRPARAIDPGPFGAALVSELAKRGLASVYGWVRAAAARLRSAFAFFGRLVGTRAKTARA
jgi:hypothetical protein